MKTIRSAGTPLAGLGARLGTVLEQGTSSSSSISKPSLV